MTDPYREKYCAFLEATGVFKDIEQLVEEDVVKAHDMGLWVNEVVTSSQNTIDELTNFKKGIHALMRMFANSMIEEFFSYIDADEDGEDDQS